MKKVECSAEFGSSTDTIWRYITNHAEYAWRSDLSNITVEKNGNTFTEYAKNGYPTEYMVTLRIPHERYELDWKNSRLTGHFTMVFQKRNSRVRLVCTAQAEGKGRIRSFFARRKLKKQQCRYLADLKKVLKEN
jgi:hypothetical protein